VKRSEDPRDYKVSFERIRSELGFEPKERVPDGIREAIAALAARVRRPLRRALRQLSTALAQASGSGAYFGVRHA
jgi:hypothetical protein